MIDDDRYFYQPDKGHGLPHDPLNAIVAPRPIGWISTLGEGGVNLAPYSFFNALGYTPPLIGFSSTAPKHTLRNARASGEFVWNLVTFDLAQAMNRTAASFEYGEDELALAGLTAVQSRIVSVPRVAESPVQFECRVTEIVTLRDLNGDPTVNTLVVGQVVGVHIARCLLRDGIFDTFATDTIMRAGGPTAYARLLPQSRFDMLRPA